MSDPDDIRRGTLKIAWTDSSADTGEAVSVACARCSGGVGMLCDACNVEVVVAALDTLRETSWPDPAELT